VTPPSLPPVLSVQKRPQRDSADSEPSKGEALLTSDRRKRADKALQAPC
jgi:hypothetical protein